MASTTELMNVCRHWQQMVSAEGWQPQHPGTEERLLVAALLDDYGLPAVMDALFRTVMAGRRRRREYDLFAVAAAMDREHDRPVWRGEKSQ